MTAYAYDDAGQNRLDHGRRYHPTAHEMHVHHLYRAEYDMADAIDHAREWWARTQELAAVLGDDPDVLWRRLRG